MSAPDDVTPERLRTSTARRAALFVALVILAFLLLNFGARAYLQHNGTNLGYRIVHAKWRLLEEMEQPVDWLVLGDSSGCHGIVPEVLTEQLGGRAVNLATLANLLVVNDAWMLQRYIERFGPPKNVVLIHAFDVWHRGYNSALIGQIPRPWGFWEDVPPTLALTDEQTRRLFLSRFVPLYAEKSTLRAHLTHLGPPTKVPFSMTPTGWVPARTHEPGRLARDLRRSQRFLDERKQFSLSNHNLKAIQVIGKVAAEHGFPVYLVDGPVQDTLARSEAFERYQRQKTARLERAIGARSRLHLLDLRAAYPAASLEVVDHVVPAVAPDYTRAVAAAIAAKRATAQPEGPGQRGPR